MTYKIIFFIIAAGIACIFWLSLTSGIPGNLGVRDGKLSPCPDSPNCVSSQATESSHRVSAIKATGDTESVMAAIRTAITEMGGEVTKSEGPYLHAVFRSKIFRFPDDLECYYLKEKGLIEVRSAARIGYSDFSVNRKRIEKLRTVLQAKF